MSDAPRTVPSADPGRAGEGLGILAGSVVSALLSAALVYSAAKAGIAPGVSPLVVLFGWVVFGTLLGPKLKRFLAIGQVTGSAGAAVTAGVVFTAPIVQIVAREQGLDVPPVDVPLLVLASIAGSLLGFGFVGLATKRFLSDPRLPAPEAVAADRLIETAVSRPDERPRVSTSLVPGLLAGVFVNLFEQLAWLRKEVATLSLPLFGGGQREGGGAQGDVDLPLPLSPLYIGIGALLTLPTALLIFAGGLVNAGTKGFARAHGMPDETFRWVGGAAMTVAVIYSLVAYVVEGRRGTQAAEPALRSEHDDALLEQTPGVRRMLVGSIAAGMLLLVVMMLRVGAEPLQMAVLGLVTLVLVSLLSGLGGLLSLQVGSSASPVSGTVFMGMLVLSLTALGVGMAGMTGVIFLVPLVVAACVAICAANDSSQDYKTLQLNHYRVSDGFKGQIIGLLGGSLVVPATLWLAHESNLEKGGLGLGDADLPAPQASFFGTVLQSLFLQSEMPWGPVMAGVALGVLAVAVEAWGKRRGMILSSLAFAVGIYLSPEMGIGMGLGAFARFLATRDVSATTHAGILMAAGLITGYALLDLLYGLVLVLFSPPAGEPGIIDRLSVGHADGFGWLPEATAGVPFTAPILIATLAFIFFNYRSRGR